MFGYGYGQIPPGGEDDDDDAPKEVIPPTQPTPAYPVGARCYDPYTGLVGKVVKVEEVYYLEFDNIHPSWRKRLTPEYFGSCQRKT